MFPLVISAIWGFAFVAQRFSMEHIGPMTFIASRFILALGIVLPIYLLKKPEQHSQTSLLSKKSLGVWLAGIILFSGITLQQIGLIYTTAGKASFITGLYVIIVPLIGIFLKRTISKGAWVGAMLAAVGLYFLSVKQNFTIDTGDAFVFASAFFWAFHVLVIDHITDQTDSFRLAVMQFVICALLSSVAALLFESIDWASLKQSALAIAYTGFLSTGLAFTLQAVAQRHAVPTHAAIIFSLESVFGVIGGYLFLNELLGLDEALGCVLMMGGMLVSLLAQAPKTSSTATTRQE